MDRTQLLHHFETLAETPEAIGKLRKLIFELAVRGQLLNQESKDGEARQLLSEVEKEKQKRFDNGKIREKLPILPVKAEVPFVTPKNWCWVRLGDLVLKLTDGTHRSPLNGPDGTFKYITAKNIKPGGIELRDVTYVTKKVHEEICSRCDPELGDLLYIKDGATTGVATINNLSEAFSMLSSVALLKVPKAIDARFLLFATRSPTFYDAMRGDMSGLAITRVTLEKIGRALIPLPPVAEQRRIVAKVEELLALCDELEARQSAAREHRTRLVRSALDHLTTANGVRPSPVAATSARTTISGISSAPFPRDTAAPGPGCGGGFAEARDGRTPDEFHRHAAFVLREFLQLTAAPEDIPALRQAILSLAVQGRLVPQNAKDEPAAAILNQCQRAARKLGINTAEQSPPIGADESPFELPSGWAWARLRHLGYLLGGGTPSKSRSELWEGTLPWVSPKDMKLTYLQDAQDHISRKALYESAVKLIPPSSLLFVVRGMILIHSFPAAINRVEVTINQDMKALRPFVPESVEFLLLACRGFRQQMLNNVKCSTHGTCKLVTERVTEFVIGLPPLAEQQRIVAKVNELMRWCDALEARLTAAQTTATHLLDATLRRILDRSYKGELS